MMRMIVEVWSYLMILFRVLVYFGLWNSFVKCVLKGSKRERVKREWSEWKWLDKVVMMELWNLGNVILKYFKNF